MRVTSMRAFDSSMHCISDKANGKLKSGCRLFCCDAFSLVHPLFYIRNVEISVFYRLSSQNPHCFRSVFYLFVCFFNICVNNESKQLYSMQQWPVSWVPSTIKAVPDVDRVLKVATRTRKDSLYVQYVEKENQRQSLGQLQATIVLMVM